MQHDRRPGGALRHDAMVALRARAAPPPCSLGHVRAGNLLSKRLVEVGTSTHSKLEYPRDSMI